MNRPQGSSKRQRANHREPGLMLERLTLDEFTNVYKKVMLLYNIYSNRIICDLLKSNKS